MLSRLTILILLFSILPARAYAAGYTVRPGDTLAGIAARYHVSIRALARANHITNVNLIRSGSVLVIPQRQVHFHYQVRWGDTLIGLAAHFNVPVSTIRALNPSLGPYLLAGQWLTLCAGCGNAASAPATSARPAVSSGGNRYVVRPGDSLSAIAARYGTTISALASANGIVNPDQVVIGTALAIPAVAAPSIQVSSVASADARALIEHYAALYGLDPALPLAVGWQESGYNQAAMSRTGAIGVMQVEPYTAAHINRLLGLNLNMYNLHDNIHAGVYWLSVLLRYYGGDTHLAIAAYYEGTRNIARHGLYGDTVQYVADVTSLMTRMGG
ncbi:MAG TPA: LysM peptidoglycan-binding domain-containing protein [Chloroflexota bacterium]|nr:LysM peptidoglycan-binding domain-containing protein [Chloroflexota bacterium]